MFIDGYEILGIEPQRLHCIDGPAVITRSGLVFWYVNDYKMTNWDDFRLEAKLTDEQFLLLILKYGQTMPTTVDELPE